MRISGRSNNQIRDVEIVPNYSPYAEGSCLIKFGNTHVLCTATVEENVPPFLRNSGKGWITAEYGMLPRSTHSRMRREASNGKQTGRTVEIQRLIGRALRATVDLNKLGERQIFIDCDVIQADGGTRTASITGAFVAMKIAVNKILKTRLIKIDPIVSQVAAVSCGIVSGKEVVDLDYAEDSTAYADVNFVLTSNMGIVEIQGTAEEYSFTEKQFNEMFSLAKLGCTKLFEEQNNAIKTA
ncbi:MAG: ribonuclease PH [Rickettsiales bacterium]